MDIIERTAQSPSYEQYLTPSLSQVFLDWQAAWKVFWQDRGDVVLCSCRQ